MSINRRNLFKLGTAAGLLPAGAVFAAPAGKNLTAAATETAAEAASGIKTLKGGVTMGAPLPGISELDLSKTFEPGKSVLNDGVVMNASHWGIGRVHV